MSKHWKPDGEIARIIPAGDRWDRRPSSGLGPWAIMVGAVVAGLVGGAVWQRWGGTTAPTDRSAIEWNVVQAVPRAADDPADESWKRRAVIASDSEAPESGLPRASGARNNGARARPSTGSGQAFGYCKWGGETNCVVDGDTFWIGGEKVRIAGIDAPETHPSRCDEEARLGEEATEKLRALLNSGAVTMTHIDRDRDKYGRLLRNVAVNGADVGEAMISAGVAREYAGGRRPWC